VLVFPDPIGRETGHRLATGNSQFGVDEPLVVQPGEHEHVELVAHTPRSAAPVQGCRVTVVPSELNVGQVPAHGCGLASVPQIVTVQRPIELSFQPGSQTQRPARQSQMPLAQPGVPRALTVAGSVSHSWPALQPMAMIPQWRSSTLALVVTSWHASPVKPGAHQVHKLG
jgi:hypothetical protein